MTLWFSFQPVVCRSSAEGSGADEPPEAAGEGHGDELLQDAAGEQRLPPGLLTSCLNLQRLSLNPAGPEDGDPPVSGSDLTPQGARADRTHPAAGSHAPSRLPSTAVSRPVTIMNFTGRSVKNNFQKLLQRSVIFKC